MINEEEIICYCKQITKAKVIDAIAQGATSLKEIQQTTSAATGNKCKETHPQGICCSAEIVKLLPPNAKSTNCCCCH